MKISELRRKTKKELEETLGEKRSRRDELVFLLAQKKTKNVKELALVKKDIARVLTLLRSMDYESRT